MNRWQPRSPRARDFRSAQRIRELQHRVEETGQPGVIVGLTDACRDCRATGALELLPGRRAVGHIYHDDGCPAATGATAWEPHPLNEGQSPNDRA